MKKILALIIFALLSFALISCGDTQGNTGSSVGGENEEPKEEMETVTVCFVVLEKDAELDGKDTVRVEKGGKLKNSKIPDVYRPGYVLEGWAYDQNGDDMWDASDGFRRDTILYAVWGEDTGDGGVDDTTGEKVTIVFKANGVDVELGGAQYVEIAKGGRLRGEQLPDAYRPCFRLEGWSYDPYGEIMWSSDDIFGTDTILYAIWSYEPDDGNDDGTDSGNGSVSSEKVTVNFRGNGKGAEIIGELAAYVEKGGTLSVAQVPEAYRDGYSFEGWAYDQKGDKMWTKADSFSEDAVLYAIWVEDSNGGGDNGGADNGDNPTPPSGKDTVTVEFNTGMGYFEDEALYEVEVEKGGRLNGLPTPLHENPAMLFDGWYKDAAFTVLVSRSDKYDANTTLYACWIERMICTDGTYDHLYSSWDTDTMPTCTKPGTVARYCNFCNAKEVRSGDPAKGHQFSSWAETFMARERTCTRLGCGEKEIESFDDVTMQVLGSVPTRQIEGSISAFFGVPLTNLVNGKWNDNSDNGGVLAPNGSGTAHVIFNFVEATALDRIYFKGDGTVNMNIYVQYEGEEDFTFIGLCGGTSEKENTPFKTPDPTKKIVKVKLQEEDPRRGESLWQEVAFVKISVDAK